jgi:hypothetical protein
LANPEALRGLPLRDVPIITFINKLDREGRDPFDPSTRSSSRWRST